MINKEERDAAVDQIHYLLFAMLGEWVGNEKINLEGYIKNPTGHVDYNPYVIVDLNSLRERAGMLGVVAHGTQLIVAYKTGHSEIATRSMHDLAIEGIPLIIYKRLADWLNKRVDTMVQSLEEAMNRPPVPIEDYASLASFDSVKFTNDLTMYKISLDGLSKVIQYIEEQ